MFAKDDEPGRLIVNDLKKDFDTESDGFRIVLDTFHDARNGYTFATNPAGAKYDAQVANEGRDIQTWGVNFEGKVRRLNEDSYWSPLPRIYNLRSRIDGGSGRRAERSSSRNEPAVQAVRGHDLQHPPAQTNDRRAGRFFLENSGIFQFGTNSGQLGGGGQGGGGGREM